MSQNAAASELRAPWPLGADDECWQKFVKQSPVLANLGRVGLQFIPPDESNGASWDQWRPTPTDNPDRTPAVLIGQLAYLPDLPEGGRPVLPLPFGPGEAHLQLKSGDPLSYAAARDLTLSIILRTLGQTTPGDTIIDISRQSKVDQTYRAFQDLELEGLLNYHDDPREFLENLTNHINLINSQLMQTGARNLNELRQSTGTPIAHRIVVVDNLNRFSQEQKVMLMRLMEAGKDSVSFIIHGADFGDSDMLRTIEMQNNQHDQIIATVRGLDNLPFLPDPPPTVELVRKACRGITHDAKGRNRDPDIAIATIQPKRPWEESSQREVSSPVGLTPDGKAVALKLNDESPHILIAGETGSGKSVILYDTLMGWAMRYGPDELVYHLLDFKEGVGFAPLRNLPNTKSLGLNVNNVPEYALSVLEELNKELLRRAQAQREHGVANMRELRERDPNGHWPRIVLVIDEFQELLKGPLQGKARIFLEKFGKQGRSFNIHLVFASQNPSEITALLDSALLGQFPTRIALRGGSSIFDSVNNPMPNVGRYQAVLNTNGGRFAPDNRVFRTPNVDSSTLDSFAKTLKRHVGTHLERKWGRPIELEPPAILDGARQPKLEEAIRRLPPVQPGRGASVVVAEALDVQSSSRTFRLSRSRGTNFLVTGPNEEESCKAVRNAAVSLAKQEPNARFTIINFNSISDTVMDSADALATELTKLANDGAVISYEAYEAPDVLQEETRQIEAKRDRNATPHYIIIYGGEHSEEFIDGNAKNDMVRILSDGPLQHTHVIGAWDDPTRMKDHLYGSFGRPDFNAGIAVGDVTPPMLSSFIPSTPMMPTDGRWPKRDGLAQFFDKRTGLEWVKIYE